MIESVSAYLENGFGALAMCESVRLPAPFPLLVSRGYRFHSCEMLEKPFVLAVAGERDDRVKIEIDRILEEFKW